MTLMLQNLSSCLQLQLITDLKVILHFLHFYSKKIWRIKIDELLKANQIKEVHEEKYCICSWRKVFMKKSI